MKLEDRYCEYLTVGKKDIAWGVHVVNTGFTKIPPHTPYPPGKHPDDHYFTWNIGRVLTEYQIIYITRGTGVFETEKQRKHIQEGTIMLLFPGTWHRYQPSPETGWDEYWVGFNGRYARHIMEENFFSRKHPILPIGQDEDLLRQFLQVFEHVQEANIGYQQVVSATTIQLLANIYAATKRKGFEDRKAERIIKKVKCRLLENISQEVDIKLLAEDLHISYSWLRKTFKYFTGLSPHQYHLQLRVQQSRHLLTSTTKSIKEIAYFTGFDSQYYFSRIFKQKTGLNPSEFRNHTQGKSKENIVC